MVIIIIICVLSDYVDEFYGYNLARPARCGTILNLVYLPSFFALYCFKIPLSFVLAKRMYGIVAPPSLEFSSQEIT